MTFGILFSLWTWAQQDSIYILGKVIELNDRKTTYPMYGASVYWLDTTIGTTTNSEGKFQLKKLNTSNQLVASYIGYKSDTIDVSNKSFVKIILEESIELDEVTITHRKKSMQLGYLDAMKTEKISSKELLKAACCNLSESFETNPSVDVSFTDAVTGTRQIQMLGLAGPYTQITRENMPDVRGLSAIYGLTYIPGTWIESIQLIKGTGSVTNGYESIAGQINVELAKPENMDKWYLNAYSNENGRLEANINTKMKVNEDWGTAILLHASSNSVKHDRNFDGFMDHPLSKQFVGLNRWKFQNNNGINFQAGIKATYIDKIGGELNFEHVNAGSNQVWGMDLKMRRLEGWTKIGKVNPDKPWNSIGLQLSGALHEQQSYFGLNKYDASQGTFYANLIYQGILSNINNKFKTGASLQYDDYKENLNTINFNRREVVPGTFFEYTYNHLDKFIAVAGIRADYHSLFGIFFTPRIHLRYEIKENTILRLSAGRGQRTANILAENSGILSTSRQINVLGDNSNKPYGLKPEIAWNFGINLSQHFTLDYRNGIISFDFYKTNFSNQVILDIDQNPQQAIFYNLEGKSYSNSFQVQLDYELIKRLDMRLAYRWYDVKTTYNGSLREKPLIANNRAFINISYETRNYWKIDYTLNWQGRKRIPDTNLNPAEYQLKDYSSDFVLMNAQVSKKWWKKFEAYLGIENILDYKQTDPILANDQPFSQYFDSSLIWGPIFGRSIYGGVRYKIK